MNNLFFQVTNYCQGISTSQVPRSSRTGQSSFFQVLGPLYMYINELHDRIGHQLLKVAGSSKAERFLPCWKMGFSVI